MSLQTLRYSWDNSTSEFCGMTICVIRSSMEKLSNRLGAYAYTANPDMNSTFGMTVSPVFGSNGGRMSYFANTLAMTSQIVEWARWIPGHILQYIVFEIWTSCQVNWEHTDLLPKPNTIDLGSHPLVVGSESSRVYWSFIRGRKRSGLNVSGSG